jgi:hypothetical protein
LRVLSHAKTLIEKPRRSGVGGLVIQSELAL